MRCKPFRTRLTRNRKNKSTSSASPSSAFSGHCERFFRLRNQPPMRCSLTARRPRSPEAVQRRGMRRRSEPSQERHLTKCARGGILIPRAFGLRNSIFLPGLCLFQNRGTESCIWAEWTAALLCLGELVCLAKIFQRVRIINAIVEPAFAQRVPRIDAECSAVGGTCQGDLSFAALITYGSKVFRTGAVAKDHAFDLDGGKSGPGIGIVRIAKRLPRYTENSTLGED